MQAELGLADSYSLTAEGTLCIWAHTETFCTNSIKTFITLKFFSVLNFLLHSAMKLKGENAWPTGAMRLSQELGSN